MKKVLFSIILSFLLYSQQTFAQVAHNGTFSPNSNYEQKVIAYPNPAKDYLYLKTNNPNTKIKSITFYSILGNIVADMPINASYSEIKVDKLKSGKYLMRYTLNDNTQKVIQIIKQ